MFFVSLFLMKIKTLLLSKLKILPTMKSFSDNLLENINNLLIALPANKKKLYSNKFRNYLASKYLQISLKGIPGMVK